MPRKIDDDDLPFRMDDLLTGNGTTPDAPAPGPIAPGTLPGTFDLEALRLRQDFDELSGTRKVLSHIAVRKPRKFEFVRTRPEEEWFRTVVYEHEQDRSFYLIAPELMGEVSGHCKPVALAGAVLRDTTPLFWPLRLPGSDGRTMGWWSSAYEAAQQAQHAWIRLSANQSAGAYDLFVAEHQHVEPVWPDASQEDLVRLAFRHHFIDRYDHPVLQALRGAVV